MSGVLRAGAGPARLLVWMLLNEEKSRKAHNLPPSAPVFVRVDFSKPARRLTELGYLDRPITADRQQAQLTPSGIKAARTIWSAL